MERRFEPRKSSPVSIGLTMILHCSPEKAVEDTSISPEGISGLSPIWFDRPWERPGNVRIHWEARS